MTGDWANSISRSLAAMMGCDVVEITLDILMQFYLPIKRRGSEHQRTQWQKGPCSHPGAVFLSFLLGALSAGMKGFGGSKPVHKPAPRPPRHSRFCNYVHLIRKQLCMEFERCAGRRAGFFSTGYRAPVETADSVQLVASETLLLALEHR